MLSDQECAWLRLHLTPGLGRKALFDLREVFPTPLDAVQTKLQHWPRKLGHRRTASLRVPSPDDPEFLKTVERLRKEQVRIVSYWDDDYPSPLRHIHDPPALLYLRGRFEQLDGLAVVGSRKCSETGARFTREVCTEIARHDIAIVSGLARGIDSSAHEGALDGDGYTIAVLGCGIDFIYPPENGRLFQRICETGAIISEYPPGTRPLAGHFPGRNRIISGLARGVLIVEAATGSGSLITADFALEQGREVFAIPGMVTAPNSRGVNRLLKDGAHLVTEAQDILDILRPGSTTLSKTEQDLLPEGLSGIERTLVELVCFEPVQIDDLARKSGLTPMELSAILLQLELREVVIQLPGMRYIRNV